MIGLFASIGRTRQPQPVADPIAAGIEAALERRRAARADRRAAAETGLAKARAARVPDPIMLDRK